jgi:hypothetical protein
MRMAHPGMHPGILGRSGDQTWTDTLDPGTGKRSEDLNVTKGICDPSPEGAAANSPFSQAIGEQWSENRLLKRREDVRSRLYLLVILACRHDIVGHAMFRGWPRLF